MAFMDVKPPSPSSRFVPMSRPSTTSVAGKSPTVRAPNMLINIYNGPKRNAYVRSQAQVVDMVLASPVVLYLGVSEPQTLFIVGGKDQTAIAIQWAPPEVAAKLGHF
ncbi:uncharacterized protein UV8b_03022 [Ustilaginoidea virens]|uniref:Uncharacterized protein n=1 Tax=Ustilaginoidea virens TaxID=1159556 RepID=A0A8E5MGF1_USTVR|nr:uncharacterized protein UV8b_03022 [Ustilaginoidea virens]QUC18781.1 hypothetical protein UV8b_03022 [Ustilaginoidea virens]